MAPFAKTTLNSNKRKWCPGIIPFVCAIILRRCTNLWNIFNTTAWSRWHLRLLLGCSIKYWFRLAARFWEQKLGIDNIGFNANKNPSLHIFIHNTMLDRRVPFLICLGRDNPTRHLSEVNLGYLLVTYLTWTRKSSKHMYPCLLLPANWLSQWLGLLDQQVCVLSWWPVVWFRY